MADQLLTIPQVAAQLGITSRTVYRMLAAKMLPRVNIGIGRARARVRQSAVDKFVADRSL